MSLGPQEGCIRGVSLRVGRVGCPLVGHSWGSAERMHLADAIVTFPHVLLKGLTLGGGVLTEVTGLAAEMLSAKHRAFIFLVKVGLNQGAEFPLVRIFPGRKLTPFLHLVRVLDPQ